jgi:general secretion pathway protein D
MIKKSNPLLHPWRSHILIFAVWFFSFIQAIDEFTQHSTLIKKLNEQTQPKHHKNNKKRKSKRTVTIDYHNESLVDIINMLAAQKEVNVVLPLAYPITTKVTFVLEEKVTLDEAWDILYTLLDLSGYSLIQQGNMYEITRTDKEINREPLPLYIGTKWYDLPESDMRIQYVYYFSYIRASEEGNFEIKTMLDKILSENAKIIINSAANSLVLADRANNIRAAMDLVTALDQVGFKEKLAYLPLRHYSAELIADLFMKEIIPNAAETNRYRLDTRAEGDINYFSRHLKIIPDKRNNALIVLGKEQSIARVKDFIYKYIDVEQDSARSILHVYQLQYLNAEKFAKVLQDIVNAPKATGQSRTGESVSGVSRQFGEGGNIIVKTDSPQNNELGKYSGGNKIIVAARHDDWVQIKKLIEELDTPRPQVIIKVLIAELTLAELRIINSFIRNPAGIPFPGSTNAQSAQSARIILENTNPSLNADLLTQVFADNSASVTSTFFNGSSAISFNDTNGRTWGLLEIADALNTRRIIGSPHVITDNNQKALIRIEESRLLPDAPTDLVGSGATQVNRKFIPAPLKLEITPRISAGDTVNLNIIVNIDRFRFRGDPADQGSETRESRHLTTNAIIKSGNILALGGLSRIDSARDLSEVPLLSKIPILGYFFKRRNRDEAETSLTIFISPIIVQPRLRSGLSDYTKEEIAYSKQSIAEGMLFDTLKDPITRWFFNPENDIALTEINDFIAIDELKQKDPFVHFDARNDQVTEESVARATETALSPEALRQYQGNPLKQPIDDVVNQPRQVPLHSPRTTRTRASQPLEPTQTIARSTNEERSEKIKELLKELDHIPNAPAA